MISRTVDTNPFHDAALGPAVVTGVVVALFAAILAVGLLVPLHCAHGGTEMLATTVFSAA
jgi:hypothetical protein